jgi:hypothetical protein
MLDDESKFTEVARRYTMMRLLIILMVLVSTSVFAEMSQFYNNHVGGTVYGRSPNGIQRYSDSRETIGTMFNKPESDIPPYNFNRRNGMMYSSGTIFDTPAGSPPMGMPQAAPQLMTPLQPFGPGLAPPFGR